MNGSAVCMACACVRLFMRECECSEACGGGGRGGGQGAAVRLQQRGREESGNRAARPLPTGLQGEVAERVHQLLGSFTDWQQLPGSFSNCCQPASSPRLPASQPVVPHALGEQYRFCTAPTRVASHTLGKVYGWGGSHPAAGPRPAPPPGGASQGGVCRARSRLCVEGGGNVPRGISILHQYACHPQAVTPAQQRLNREWDLAGLGTGDSCPTITLRLPSFRHLLTNDCRCGPPRERGGGVWPTGCVQQGCSSQTTLLIFFCIFCIPSFSREAGSASLGSASPACC